MNESLKTYPRKSTGTAVCACGSKKQYTAVRCRACNTASRKPTLDTNVYMIEGVTCRALALTQGQYALVWESDFSELSKFIWHAVWSKSTQGYYAFRKRQTLAEPAIVSMARHLKNPPDDREVDHENHRTLDNRRSNLRIATAEQNSNNRRKRSDNTSGVTGVIWHTVASKWFAYIHAGGKRINLGYYGEFGDAVTARKTAEASHHGEFACRS